ncbi:CGNR zinc finger domain-containing protein, partial [Streptomyces sp. NPDC003631]
EDPAPPPTTPSSSSPTRPSSSSPAPTATGCAPASHPTACSSSSRTTHAGKWCSPTCGNRMRVARHHRRHHTPEATDQPQRIRIQTPCGPGELSHPGAPCTQASRTAPDEPRDGITCRPCRNVQIPDPPYAT